MNEKQGESTVTPTITDPRRRAQVIESRSRLLDEINQILAVEDDDRRIQARINRLRLKYGRDEVDRLLLYMTELLNTETEDLDAFHYQRYHETYRHFGGGRPALDVDQWQELTDEWTPLHIRVASASHLPESEGSDPLSPKDQERYDQIKDILLSDSFLWDDITPRNPGQYSLPSLRVMMRQFRKRKTKEAQIPTISSQATAPMLISGTKLCSKHNMPILKLGGREQCVQEYLSDCLAGKKIVAVEVVKKTAFYVFEDGHRFPLLCGCCGAPYATDDVHEWRADMVGRTFLTVTSNHEHDVNGQGYDSLLLNFSHGGHATPGTTPVAFTAAARIEHPGDCPQSKG